MKEDELWRRMLGVFRQAFDLDELVLTPATTAADVEGWDSVSNIALMVALEAEFGIRFNTGEMADLENVGQLAERIAARHDG